MEEMKKIGERIRTQDNRVTSNPIFIVQQRRKIYGVGDNFTDSHEWIDSSNDHEIANELESVGLDATEANGGDTGGWERVGYVEVWEFVTACFTEVGCQNYIDANSHNLTEPRIYAASAYRNREFIAVRAFLMSL